MQTRTFIGIQLKKFKIIPKIKKGVALLIPYNTNHKRHQKSDQILQAVIFIRNQIEKSFEI